MDMTIIEKYEKKCGEIYPVNTDLYDEFHVKRGLRDKSGQGVVAGITNISKIVACKKIDGINMPCEGELYYRGYSINEFVDGLIKDDRYGFEEVAHLLLLGELPNKSALDEFNSTLSQLRKLPKNFTRDVILKAPTKDMMMSLSKSVLTLGSYDKKADDISVPNVIRQCLMLISVFPMLAVYGYHAYNHFICDDSLYIHRPDDSLSTAQNFLRMLRPDQHFSELEAKVLDLAFILHMEHGGGNNSTFTTRVVTSSGTDTYSAISAALASLKGAKHGGANLKVVQMMKHIRENVKDIEDEDEVYAYLIKILKKEVFDRKGLIYGMGHAVYSLSDPRAQVFKRFVEQLSKSKGKNKLYSFYELVERLATKAIANERAIYKGVSANVDFYSGFVYSMLGIPVELYTPMFAIARIVGWSAHRLEELINADKIIRPSYIDTVKIRPYQNIGDRK